MPKAKLLQESLVAHNNRQEQQLSSPEQDLRPRAGLFERTKVSSKDDIGLCSERTMFMAAFTRPFGGHSSFVKASQSRSRTFHDRALSSNLFQCPYILLKCSYFLLSLRANTGTQLMFFLTSWHPCRFVRHPAAFAICKQKYVIPNQVSSEEDIWFCAERRLFISAFAEAVFKTFTLWSNVKQVTPLDFGRRLKTKYFAYVI